MKIFYTLLLFCGLQMSYAQDIVINEFMASSDSLSGIEDGFGEYDDWIELHNLSNSTVDLSGYFLSDNFETPQKWKFPDGVSIAANGYLIVWADGDTIQGDLHTNYKLNKQGEEVLLSAPNGNLLDSISYEDQETNISMARIPNGTGNFTPGNPTFNANNESTTSLLDLSSFEKLTVFPNPAKSIVWLELNNPNPTESESGQLRIYDTSGRLWRNEQIDLFNGKASIDLSSLDHGLYIVQLSIGQRKLVNRIHLNGSH